MPSSTSIPATSHTEDLLRATISELDRVVEGDAGDWTVTKRLPAVVQVAQLGVFGRLVLGVMTTEYATVFPHKAKLDELFGKVSTAAKKEWTQALNKTRAGSPKRNKYLEDTRGLQPVVRALVKYADRTISLRGGMRLGSFGIKDLQDSLALLVGKVSEAMAAKLEADSKAKAGSGRADIPGPVYGAVTIGVLAGGLVGRREMTSKELSAARIACRLGAKKDEAGGPETKPVKKARKTLKELGAHLPEQRA